MPTQEPPPACSSTCAPPMHAEFSRRAHRAVISALNEALQRGHSAVEPEHLLLGLLQDTSCRAVHIARNLGANVTRIAKTVRNDMKRGEPAAWNSTLPFAQRTRQVLECALAEARALGRNEIGTELMLLGLLSEKHSTAAHALRDAALVPEDIRREVIRQLGPLLEDLGPATRTSSLPLARDANQIERLLGTCHGNHVPPLSATARWLQRILLWASIPVVLTGLYGVYNWVGFLEYRIQGIQLFFLLALLPCFGWLLFVASFRLQAHILELMFVVPACSLPLGVALNMGEQEDMLCWSVGIVGGLMVAAGSVWGLSVLQRSGEKRTWRRLAVLALGWVAGLGAPAVALIAGDLSGASEALTSGWHYLLALALIAALVPAVLLEFRCGQRFGPLRVW